jgi:hypothetical protein
LVSRHGGGLTRRVANELGRKYGGLRFLLERGID